MAKAKQVFNGFFLQRLQNLSIGILNKCNLYANGSTSLVNLWDTFIVKGLTAQLVMVYEQDPKSMEGNIEITLDLSFC